MPDSARTPYDYFDELRRKQQAGPDDPVEATVRAMQGQRVRRDLVQAGDPDQTARATRLSREIGVPPALIEDRLDEVEAGSRANTFADFLANSTAMTRWAQANPRGAVAASDDTQSLGLLGSAWDTLTKIPARTFGEGVFQSGAGLRFVTDRISDWGSVASAFLQTIAPPSGAAIEAGVDPYDIARREIAGRAADREQMRQTASGYADRHRGTNWATEQVLSGFSSTLPSLTGAGVAAVTRNPEAGLAVAVSPVFGNSYDKARGEGLSPSQSLLYSGQQTFIEGVTERLPVGFLAEMIVKRLPFGKALARQLFAENIGEQAATHAQDFVDWAMLPENSDKTFGDYLEARPSAALATALATTGATTAQTAAATGLNRAITATSRVSDRIGQANQARAERQAVDQLVRGAEGSKLRQRDPEAFRELVRQQAEAAGASSVFIPGEAIRTFQQSDSYDSHEDPFSRFDVDEAAGSGGDVVMPIADVLTDLVGTKAWEAIKNDVRLAPGGMSTNEATTFNEAMDDIMADLGDKAATQDAADASQRTAREKIVDRVAEAFGVSFTSPTARTIAEVFAQRAQTRAARLGQELTGDETDGFSVRQVMPEGVAEAVKADKLDLVINSMRQRKDAVTGEGPSLLEFIKERGGINDTGGDLASMGVPAKYLRDFDPSQGELTGGLSGQGDFGADTTLRAAIEAGYFPELANVESEAGPSQLDTQALLDAVQEEVAGRPRHASVRDDHVRRAAEDLRAMLEDSGIDPDAMSDAEVRAAVEGMESEQSQGRAFEQALPFRETAATKQWARDVDAIVRGDPVPKPMLTLGNTPAILHALGLPDAPLTMRKAKVAKARKDHPEVSLDTWRSLPALLADPRAVFPSPKGDGSIVVAINATDADGKPIIVPVLASVQDGNVVLSVHGRDPAYIASGIAAAQKDGETVYVKEGLADALSTEAGVRDLPPRHAPDAPEVPAKPARKILSLRDVVKKLDQEARGRIIFDQNQRIIELFQSRNLSTPLHELSHMWLEELAFDASLPDAPEQLKADWAAAKRYFAANGHKVGKDGQIPVEAHELWARSGERYLMEGKAPSGALTRLFEQFRGWLVGIYKTVDKLRAPITPEIREVFDRLLATDEEIAAAQERQGLEALFKDAAEIGMSEPEFAAYQRQVEDAKAGAHASLLDKTMRTIRRREEERYRDARKNIRAEETERIDAAPIYKALRLMKDQRVSREWIRDEFGEDALDLLPVRVPPLHTPGGAHPDAIAEQAGYASGQEMIEALIGAERAHRQIKEAGDKRSMRERAIETATDAEFARRYGDPLNDGSIEREALGAVHSEMQGEVIASELRVLARKTGQRPTPYRIARDWARAKVRGGTVAHEASPSAIQRHARNAAKAAREAEKAMLKHDVGEAFRQKQFQMLNNALLAEAKEAGDEVAAAVRRMEKIARARTRKSVDQEYLEQAQALLEAVDLKQRTQKSIDRQGKWSEFAAAREAEGYDMVVPPSFEATIGKTNWSRLGVEDLLALDEGVKQVLHLGKLKQALRDKGEEREWKEITDEAVQSAGNISGPPPKGLEDPSFWDGIKAGVAGADAALLKLETVFDWLDGGDPNGVFNRIAFRPVADAQTREQDMVKDYHGRIRVLFEAVPATLLNRWSDKLTLPFTDPYSGRPARFSRQRLVAMALNIGNEGNLQRLADGYGWNAQAIESYLVNELRPEEWQFVQGVWDTIDTLWPEIEAMERQVNGFAPEKVAPRAVALPDGTSLAGGYYPAIYDETLDLKSEERRGRETDLFESNYTRASTRASATKERAGKVSRPLLLDLGVINRHLGEVIHDVTHREAVMQAHRFLTNAKVVAAVDAALGPEIRKAFRPWVQFVANSWAMERAGNEGFGKWIGKLRANAVAVGLGLRATTMVTQLAGYSNSVEVVGETWMAKALAQSTAHPVESGRFVMERSGEVRHRMDTLDRDIRTELARIAAKNPVSKAKAKLDESKAFMFHGIGLMDRVVVVPTWIAAYNRALYEGAAEQDAVYAADKAVRQSQGAGAPKDLAAIQRGTGKWGEALKLFTMFYSYMSAYYQRQRTFGRDVAGKDTRRPRNLPRLAARAFWLVIVPPMLTELLKMPLGAGGPDDDEWWFQWVMRKLLANSLGPIPMARDVFEPAWNKAIKGHFYNPSISPIQRAYESLVNSAGDAGNMARGDETKHATKDLLETAGYATGLVPGQLATATQFLVDVGAGDADPEGWADWIEGLATGRLKEDAD